MKSLVVVGLLWVWVWVVLTGGDLQLCCGESEGGEGGGGEDDNENIAKEHRLVECVKKNGEQKKAAAADARFILLSYSTTSIYSYAAYGHLINAAYAHSRDYGYALVDAERGNYEPQDPRWNKVQIVLRELDTRLASSSSARGLSSYLVWMDSDLVVLHHDLRLEGIVAAHPNAHLILSRDPRPENGVANTGCFLVRVSPFARHFLAQWWDTFGRLDGMDQHVFQRLWEALPAEQQDWVALLPPNAINSDHPVWRRHTADSPVLHLVGMNSVVRREVFRGLARQLCDAWDAAYRPAPAPANASSWTVRIDAAALERIVMNDTLLVVAEQALLQRASRLEKETGSLRGANISRLLDAIEAVESRARDLRQRGYGASHEERVPDMACRGRKGSAEAAIQWSLFCSLQNLFAAEPHQSVRLLQLHADVGMDLIAAVGADDEIDAGMKSEVAASAIVDGLLPLIDQLAALAVPARRPHALYYKFKLLEYRARSNSGHASIEQEIIALYSALAAWEEMSLLGWHGSGNNLLDPGREAALLRARLGSLLCNQASASSRQEGARALEAAVGEMERAWASRTSIAAPLSVVEATAQALLALTLCRLGQPEARDTFNRAVLLHRQWQQRLEHEPDRLSMSAANKEMVGRELDRIVDIIGNDTASSRPATVYRKRKRVGLP